MTKIKAYYLDIRYSTLYEKFLWAFLLETVQKKQLRRRVTVGQVRVRLGLGRVRLGLDQSQVRVRLGLVFYMCMFIYSKSRGLFSSKQCTVIEEKPEIRGYSRLAQVRLGQARVRVRFCKIRRFVLRRSIRFDVLCFDILKIRRSVRFDVL